MLKVSPPNIDWRLFLLPLFVFLVPLVLFFGVRSDTAEEAKNIVNNDTNVRRIVIVIVDSLRKSNVEEDMPKLKERAQNSLYLPLDTCLANFTLPCIQTLMEGRESSPVSAIHNFTGSKSNHSILSILSRKKWKIETYSDHTAGALFSDLCDINENLDTYPGNHLQKDLALIAKAKASLQENKNRQILILHVPGTDKKVHGTPVGSKAYRDHFASVDRALDDLLNTLDFEQDFLFISGDHGHNDKGFHQTESIAILKAPPYFELDKIKTPRLAAVDLVFLLSFATNSLLTDGYEGRHFWLAENGLNSQKMKFRNGEDTRLRAQHLSGDNMGDLLGAQRERHKEKTVVSAINVSSVLLLLLALMLTTLFPNQRWKGADLAALSVAILLSFFFFVDVQFLLPALLFRVFLFGIAFFFIFFNKVKIGILATILFGLSLATAFFDTSIHDYFREGDGGDFVLIIYGSATLLSLLAGLLFFPGVLVNEEKEARLDFQGKTHLLELRKSFRLFVVGFSGLVGMLALGSGGYFYSSSTNYFNMFFFVGAIVLFSYVCIHYLEHKTLPTFPKSKRLALHLVVFLSTVVILQFTDQFNWRWIFLPTAFLKTQPMVAYGLIFLSLAYFWWALKDRRLYYFGLLPLSVFSFIYTSWAGLELGSFAVSLLPSLLLVSFFTMRGVAESPYRNTLEEGFDALLLFSVVYATIWLGMDGFDISNIDYTYFDKHFPEYVKSLSTDIERVLFYTPFTLPKYLLMSILPLFIFLMMRGFQLRVLLYTLGIFLVQILFLIGDIAFSVSAGSVLAGSAVDDLVFVWLISLALTFSIALSFAASRFRKTT